jgi:Spy/CpxP family protein refolding chaperone
MSRTLVGIAACTVLVLATSAMAQQRGQGRGGFGGRGGMFRVSKIQLLQAEQVQKELELVDDQKEQIGKIADESREGMRDLFPAGGLRDLSDEERTKRLAEVNTKMEERNKEVDKKLDTVLLDHQKTRLNEIYIQARGTQALTDKEIATALNISDDQKKKIEATREENQRAQREAFTGGDFDPEKARTMRREADEKVLAVLTAEQRDKFEKMQGKKIDLPRGGFGRGGAGGGRRQRDNQ